MKKTELQNIILEDNKKSYSFTLDKEKLFKDFNEELKENNNSNKSVKLNKTFLKYIITITCCLVVVVFIGIYYRDQRKGPKTTEEFDEYVSEYVLVQKKLCYLDVDIAYNINIYIYKYNSLETKDGNIYYFYFFKTKNKEVYLIDNNKKEEILLQNNDFGILAIHLENEKDDKVEFCLKIDGKTKKYEIN